MESAAPPPSCTDTTWRCLSTAAARSDATAAARCRLRLAGAGTAGMPAPSNCSDRVREGVAGRAAGSGGGQVDNAW